MDSWDLAGEKLERSVFRFIFRYSARQQIVVLFLTAVSFPVYYISLELPKQIINRAIDAEASRFPQPIVIFGREVAKLTQLELLAALTVLFLLFVLANLALKFVLNLYKGLLGERMLRRLRYQLFDRVIRFPLPRFKRLPKGDLVSMITSEVESIGGFVGEALATPLYQGGLLVTALLFIFVQDWLMGLLAVAFYPIQVVVIPYLQSQVNELGRQRVQEIRRLSNKLNETVEMASEIRGNRTARYELADFSARLGQIFRIRYQIYHKKFLIKFLNNFFGQLTPFMFFGIGGYLVITAKMSLGELVAILAAYKDLAPPWRELLDFYQDQQNARIRYDQIISTFAATDPGLLETPAGRHVTDGAPEGRLRAANLSVAYNDASHLEDVSFDMGLDEHLAAIGESDTANRHLAWLVAGLIEPSRGTLTIGDQPYSAISESWFEEKVAYVDNDPGMTSGSVFENIIYSLKRDPHPAPGPLSASRSAAPRTEELLSGNSPDDAAADWIDYAAIGLSGPGDLKAAVLHAAEVADLEQDLFDLGFGAYVDPETHPDIAAAVLSARRSLRAVLDTTEFRGAVALLDPDTYNPHASVLENILFGDPIGPRYEADQVLDRGIFRSVLKRSGLGPRLLELGLEIAQGLLPATSAPLEGNGGGPEPSQLSSLRVLLGHAAIRGLNRITGKEKHRLERLALGYCLSEDDIPKVGDAFIERVLMARKMFAEGLSPRQRRWIAAYKPETFCPTLTVRENILFAKIKRGQGDLPQRLRSAMLKVLEAEGLGGSIREAGLLYQVGTEGAALSSDQRQKLAIARAVIKHPDLLVACQATAGLGELAEQRIIRRIRDDLRGRGIFWISSDEKLGPAFDRSISI